MSLGESLSSPLARRSDCSLTQVNVCSDRPCILPPERVEIVMSYSVLAWVVAMIAGIATVHAFTPRSGESAAPSRSRGQIGQEHLSPGGRITLASLETNRPPVPILLARRPGDGAIAGASRDSVSRDDAAALTNGVLSEGIARAAILRDGYMGIHSLRPRSDGSWQARALRGSVDIEVTVDAAGNVTAN